ncbi:MAG: 50S ribosomal protein L2 [Candidatus Bathyarchaeota archaeon]|nr:50S ribosomal protein L2 [Candidatus Bathyarchaeota archaeon]MDW8039917.1 50S ribosomal protein L2 [Nitrososphaerota archaeon]
MGKRIRVQRRGRGGPTFKAATHKRVAPACYPPPPKNIYETVVRGVVEEIVHDPGRGAPLALIRFENGQECYVVASEGIFIGQPVEMGGNARVDVGNIMPVGKIPEGTLVCNIELKPGDGGKIAKSSGAYATIVAHTPQGTMIKLPSGKTKYISDQCLATIGVVSGAGRTEKPFLKAGAKYHLMRARGRKYPRTRGRAMVAAVHPYGSSKRSARKVTTVSRNAPPGQKVGLIAARGAGRRKKRVKEEGE